MPAEATSLRAPADSSHSGHFSSRNAAPGTAINLRCPEDGSRVSAKEFCAREAFDRAVEEFRGREAFDRAVDLRENNDEAMLARRAHESARRYPSWMRCTLCGALRDETGYCSRMCSRDLAPGMQAVPQPLPVRREPTYRAGNVRFGRTRLFLSKFIGRIAWRGAAR